MSTCAKRIGFLLALPALVGLLIPSSVHVMFCIGDDGHVDTEFVAHVDASHEDCCEALAHPPCCDDEAGAEHADADTCPPHHDDCYDWVFSGLADSFRTSSGVPAAVRAYAPPIARLPIFPRQTTSPPQPVSTSAARPPDVGLSTIVLLT